MQIAIYRKRIGRGIDWVQGEEGNGKKLASYVLIHVHAHWMHVYHI
jgi:hypothetical protein